MYAKLESPLHESIFDAITRWASLAPGHLLAFLLWTGTHGAIGVILIDARRWPAAAPMIAAAALGGWGLLERRASAGRILRIVALEWVLVLLGTAAVLITAFVVLFWLMGPAPIL